MAWLSDPEVRTGTNRLVPDTGAPPDPAHHSPPHPWPSYTYGPGTCHVPGVTLVTKEMAARVWKLQMPHEDLP